MAGHRLFLPTRTYPRLYTAIADNELVGVPDLFLEEKKSFPAGAESAEEERQLLQRTSTSAVLHGRLDPGTLTFEPESDSGERCVRSEIFGSRGENMHE